MSFTFASSQAILYKAGIGRNSDASSSHALLSSFCDQAEAYVCVACKKNFISSSASITANLIPMVARAVTALAAIDLIQYDMTGYMSTTQAQTQMNVLKDEANETIKILQDIDNRAKMGL